MLEQLKVVVCWAMMYEYYQFAMNMYAGQQVDILASMAFAIMCA
jgi:hypothetical protein